MVFRRHSIRLAVSVVSLAFFALACPEERCWSKSDCKRGTCELFKGDQHGGKCSINDGDRDCPFGRCTCEGGATGCNLTQDQLYCSALTCTDNTSCPQDGGEARCVDGECARQGTCAGL